jgi:hypothetical protein
MDPLYYIDESPVIEVIEAKSCRVRLEYTDAGHRGTAILETQTGRRKVEGVYDCGALFDPVAYKEWSKAHPTEAFPAVEWRLALGTEEDSPLIVVRTADCKTTRIHRTPRDADDEDEECEDDRGEECEDDE